MKSSRTYRVAMVAAAILPAALLSCVTAAPPRLGADAPERSYISPANADGVMDSFSLPVSVIPEGKNVLYGYRISAADAAGKTVWSMERTIPDPKKNIWEALLVDLKLKRVKGIETPELVVWDGRMQDGAFAPDGDYAVTISAWDGKKRTVSSSFSVIVDNTPPAASASSAYLVFSPNGDGNKDYVDITQNGSGGASWTGSISDKDGRVVLAKAWSGAPDAAWRWEGTDEAGKKVPDGLYSYALTGTDEAGNKASAELRNLAVNTSATPFFIALSGKAFSPNGDGIRDRLLIQPILDVQAGFVS